MVTLAEDDGDGVVLSLDAARAAALADSGLVQVRPFGAARWWLLPRGRVGAVSLDGVDVVVTPKVGIARLLFLLGYAANPGFRPEDVEGVPDEDLWPAIAETLCRHGELTDRARNVVMAAQNEARAANNDEIGPEHLALGLLNEPDALGAGSIVAQGVALETVRRTVTATLPAAADRVPELIPFDSRARKALELTFREALRLGHDYVGTEHILLALLELEDGAGVLAGLGVDKGAAEANVTAAVAAALAAHEQN